MRRCGCPYLRHTPSFSWVIVRIHFAGFYPIHCGQFLQLSTRDDFIRVRETNESHCWCQTFVFALNFLFKLYLTLIQIKHISKSNSNF